MMLPPELQALVDTYRAGLIDLDELRRRAVAWGLTHPQDAALVERLMDALKGASADTPPEATSGGEVPDAARPTATAKRADDTLVRTSPSASSSAVRPTPSEIQQTTGHPPDSEAATLVAPPPQPAPREPREGDVIKNRFVLERRIGRGGMGAVFKARDLRKEEARDREPFVAVKVLSGDIRNHPDAFIALQRESKKAQKLAHPNTVTVYDFDRDGDLVFMTMELLEGESLAQLLRRHPKGLPLEQALPIVRGIVESLDYAHRQGIVHADLKPGNVFVTRNGVVKVLDFGIARALRNPSAPPEDATVFDPAALGALTPAYASAEMIEGADPDPRDDVYALACLVYELLTGRHPFGRVPATQARAQGIKPAPAPGLSRRQWRALLRGLDHQRDQRTPSVKQLYEELVDRRRTRRRWAVLMPLGMLVPGGLGLYLLWHSPQAPTPPPPDPAKLAELLELADLQRQSGRLLAPPGSNAYDAYREVLALDPQNERAREGLRKIADVLASEAMRLYSTERPEAARRLVEQALRYFPEDRALEDLRARLEQ